MDEARILNHDYIGSEHLLLALLRQPEGIAARVLDELGVTADTVLVRLEPGATEHGAGALQLPFRPEAKNSLDQSRREADALEHCAIGTEHLLLGLMGDEASAAAGVLRAQGVEPLRVREAVLRSLSSDQT